MELNLPQPAVLLYEIRDPARLNRIRRYLEGAGIRALTVEANQLRQPIGALLGLPGFAEAPELLPAALGEEMLVMYGFRDRMLGELLAFFRQECPPGVSLKAMVTSTNVNWSSLALFEELRRERAYFQSQAKAKER